MKHKNVICFGEILWDALPSGKRLGGAPLNVALNLHSLGISAGVISAVGDDSLGNQAIRIIQDRGLSTNYIARSSLPTGVVDVVLDEEGNADYTIHMPAAWDDISWHPRLRPVVEKAEVLVFGTLAFRNEITRNTLLKALDVHEGKSVADLNLRTPFYDELLVDEVLTKADIAKVNEEELRQILQWKQKEIPNEQALNFLAELYNLEMILLSRGAHGAAIWHSGQHHEQPAYQINIKDTVGAGDGFLAGALYQILQEQPADKILPFANAVGAYVASSQGAVPQLEWQEIEDLMR